MACCGKRRRLEQQKRKRAAKLKKTREAMKKIKKEQKGVMGDESPPAPESFDLNL